MGNRPKPRPKSAPTLWRLALLFMPTKAYELEPELLQPVPRVVRTSGTACRDLWVLFLMGTMIPAAAFPMSYGQQHEFHELKTRGVVTPGSVAALHWPDRGGPWAEFRYNAGGRRYTYSRDISPAQYRNATLGDRADITYQSEHPKRAELTIVLDAQTRSHAALVSAAAGVAAVALATPFWLYLWFQLCKARRLARFGATSCTTRIEARLVHVKSNRGDQPGHWRASYEFQAEGRTISGRSDIPYQPGTDWNAPGMQATVLYDPGKPEVNHLYPAVQRHCLVRRASECVSAASDSMLGTELHPSSGLG